MKRRDLLKFGFFGALAAGAGTGFLKIYKHHTGVKKVFEFPAPILRKISSPVDTIDDKIISLSRHMIATLRYYSLIGFISKAFLSRGLAAPQVGVSKQLIACGIHGRSKCSSTLKSLKSGEPIALSKAASLCRTLNGE